MKPRVLITGTTSGIGRELMQHYHREGWQVVAFNRRQDQELESHFPGVQFCHADVRNREAIRDYFRQASARGTLPELYYLNAGINQADCLDTFSLDAFQEVWDINLIGVLNFIDAALPCLRGKTATFVASSSTSNIFPNPNNVAYYISKLAEEKIFRMLDQKYRSLGWRFKVLILSPIATDIFVGGALASKLQNLVRAWMTVPVEKAIPVIVRFAHSRRPVLYYKRSAALLFSLAALVKRFVPAFYQGSVCQKEEAKTP